MKALIEIIGLDSLNEDALLDHEKMICPFPRMQLEMSITKNLT